MHLSLLLCLFTFKVNSNNSSSPHRDQSLKSGISNLTSVSFP